MYMKNSYLLVAVFVGGAAVLSLEILGTRILGPYYGVDLFLWSALITTTLAALSIGYLIGGRLADRTPRLLRLCVSVGIAGVWVLLIPVVKFPVLSLTEQFGLRVAVLMASVILFFPPLMLLGTICPLAVKLRVEGMNEVGRTVGNLYAISTIASVFSALLSGFFFIPMVGVNRLTLIVGFLLIATAVVGFIIEKKTTLLSATVVLLVPFVISAHAILSTEQPDPQHGLLAIAQSPYAELRVLDTENGRHLLVDGGIHSLVDTSTWKSTLKYVAAMDLPRYFFDGQRTALVIGLGAGSLVKQYKEAWWKVDAVEIDPVVIRLARTYFNLQPSDGTVTEMDGRQYLRSTQKKYDVILLDAFGSSSIPFHLVTKESFDLFASHLNTNGIVALNVETIGWNDPIIKSLAATLRQVFSDVLALPTQEPPNQVGNVVLLASPGKLVPKREPQRNETLDPEWRFGPGYQIVHAWDNRFTPNIKGVDVITDDLNGVDLRSEAINLEARRNLHEYFGKRRMDQ